MCCYIEDDEHEKQRQENKKKYRVCYNIKSMLCITTKSGGPGPLYKMYLDINSREMNSLGFLNTLNF